VAFPSTMQKVVGKATGTLAEIAKLVSTAQQRTPFSRHNAFAMIRSCVPARLSYWLRTVPPSLTKEVAVKLDKEIYNVCADMLHIPLLGTSSQVEQDVADDAFDRLFLPYSSGGVCVASGEDAAEAAW
jgi:hypothetical protein